MHSRSLPQLLLALLLVGSLGSCHHRVRGNARIIGTTNVITVERDRDGFRHISLSGIGRLILTQGTRNSVELSAAENLMGYLLSDVSDGVLRLRPRSGVTISTNSGVVWRVTVRDLESIRTDGAVSVDARGIDEDLLFIDMDGVSEISISGTVREQKVHLSGVATYDARDLESEVADFTADGLLTVHVNADELQGRVCGVGSLNYVGSPKLSLHTCALISLHQLR